MSRLCFTCDPDDPPGNLPYLSTVATWSMAAPPPVQPAGRSTSPGAVASARPRRYHHHIGVRCHADAQDATGDDPDGERAGTNGESARTGLGRAEFPRGRHILPSPRPSCRFNPLCTTDLDGDRVPRESEMCGRDASPRSHQYAGTGVAGGRRTCDAREQRITIGLAMTRWWDGLASDSGGHDAGGDGLMTMAMTMATMSDEVAMGGGGGMGFFDAMGVDAMTLVPMPMPMPIPPPLAPPRPQRPSKMEEEGRHKDSCVRGGGSSNNINTNMRARNTYTSTVCRKHVVYKHSYHHLRYTGSFHSHHELHPDESTVDCRCVSMCIGGEPGEGGAQVLGLSVGVTAAGEAGATVSPMTCVTRCPRRASRQGLGEALKFPSRHDDYDDGACSASPPAAAWAAIGQVQFPPVCHRPHFDHHRRLHHCLLCHRDGHIPRRTISTDIGAGVAEWLEADTPPNSPKNTSCSASRTKEGVRVTLHGIGLLDMKGGGGPLRLPGAPNITGTRDGVAVIVCGKCCNDIPLNGITWRQCACLKFCCSDCAGEACVRCGEVPSDMVCDSSPPPHRRYARRV